MLKIDKMHSMDDYMKLLETSNKVFIDNARLERAVHDACYRADDLQAVTLLELRIESSGSYQSVSPDNIIDFLEDIGVDFEKQYRNKKTQGYSLDMKRVVNPLIERGIAVDLLTAYKEFRSYKTYASFLKKLSTQRHVYNKTADGRIILDYDTSLTQQDNLRVYYHDIAVVSIPKRFSSIVTGPSEEYHIAWCDYPQADWRFAYNLFIKDKSNSSVMSSCADAYEGLARIVEGDKFDINAFKETRKEYKVNCLKVFYNSRDKKAIPSAMREYFLSRKKYRSYLKDLAILYQFKLPIPCTSYFGFTQLLPEGSYPDAFISKGLNTPIQTFTSHIVNETVMGILHKFWDLGYTKDDINIYYVRHDEPLFLFRDTIIKDAWIFKDCSQIHIDGFTPISLDFHFGNFYQEEDEYLTTQMRTEMEKHSELLHMYPIGEMHDYYPVPSVEQLYVQVFSGGEGQPAEVVYYNYKTTERTILTTNKTTVEDALLDTVNVMVERLGSPVYLLVCNANLDFMDKVGFNGNTLMKVVAKYDSSVVISRNGKEFA